MASFLAPARDPRVDDSTYWYNRLVHTPADFELHNEHLHARGACALGNAISIDTHLKRLIVGPNKITFKGAEGLADGIGRNQAMLNEFIILDGNEIGPAGCKAFVAAVLKNNRIRSFSIFDRSIREEGEVAVARTLKEMGRGCPQFEGFPLSKYCVSIFGLPAYHQQKNNADLLHLFRSSSSQNSGPAFVDAGSSRSDKYDADDYDDDNFKTVSLIDGSHSPFITPKSIPAVTPPPNLQAAGGTPLGAAPPVYAQPSLATARSAPGRCRTEDPHLPTQSRGLSHPGSGSSSTHEPKKRAVGMPEPPPPMNPFMNAMAGEGAAVRGAADARLRRYNLSSGSPAGGSSEQF